MKGGIPTLADQLTGKAVPVPRALPTRVHSLDHGDRTPRPVVQTFNPVPTEDTMPRKPKLDPASDQPKKRRGRPPGKRKHAIPRKRKGDRAPIGAAGFVIDDRGGMEIRDGQQNIRLEPDDVERLGAFMKKHTG